MTKELPQTARRSFLSRFGMGAALVASVGAGLAAARPAVAQTNAFKPRRHAEDAWIETPNVAHRVVIDSAFPPAGGAALLYANDDFLANKSGYGLEARVQSSCSGTFQRRLPSPTPFGLGMVRRCQDVIEFKNPVTKSAPATNLYNSSAAGMSLTNRGVTLSSLVERNVQFAVCGSAMRFLANAIAQRTKGDADAIYKEFAANLVPNSHIAPAGVVAVNRAQEYGYTLLTAV